MKTSDNKKITKKEKIAVLTESGYRCACPSCTNELTIDVHHIVEVQHGGKNEVNNLLPLCPYCHDKYHRGIIDKASIVEWKKRTSLIYESSHVHHSAKPDFGMMFAVSYSEYSRRCFPIYYFYTYEGKVKYYQVGYATFIEDSLLITAKKVIDRICMLEKEIPGGRASLLIGHESLDFKVKSTNEWGEIVFLESESLESLKPPDLLVANKYQMDRVVPDNSKIKEISGTPFIGQQLGYLFGVDSSEKLYAMHDYAFGVSFISHFLRSKPPTVDRYAMTPCLSNVTCFGGPVFTCSGTLSGIVIDTIPNVVQSGHSIGSIVVIGSFWGIDYFKGKFITK